jgi:tetratricopeptide (TPR) repeat protein
MPREIAMQFAHLPASLAFILAATLCPAQAPNHVHYAPSPDAAKPAPSGAVAPRLQDLGDHVFPVTTKTPQARLFINQGVNLAYGFNHAEAARSFREAARLDPECAMAYWGEALVLGPNINVPMDPADETRAFALVQKAVALAPNASPREQAYIQALAQRYSGKPVDRTQRDRAYADAMRDLHRQYPKDLDAATLFAESLMDLRPWNYWTPDGHPYPQTTEAVVVLEQVLQENPYHPGANHYYIHLMELPYPERAESAADRLNGLMPGAGHMVHMPSHIYERVGRYSDASAVNELAVQADQDYIAQCRAQGIYPITYFPHNYHFLWSSLTMEGRSQAAIEAARKTAARIPAEAVSNLPIVQGFLVVPYYALVRFGKWQQILQEPAPAQSTPFINGVWHYSRGMAYGALGQYVNASQELQALRDVGQSPAMAELATWSSNSAGDILAIAVEALAGELAARRQHYDAAIAHLDKAVRLQDALDYIEPPDWHYPIRHSLGAVLLLAGRPSEAEVVYWDDLRQNPENGWALFGLQQSLTAQGKKDQAAEIGERFSKAWAQADVTLTSSRF